MSKSMITGAAITWSAFWVFCYWAAAYAPMREQHQIVITVLTALGLLGAYLAYKLMVLVIDWVSTCPDSKA